MATPHRRYGRRTSGHERSSTFNNKDHISSSFNDLSLPGVPESDFRLKIDQLNTQCDHTEFESVEEWTQAYNLMTYCYWRIRNKTAAIQCNEKALLSNPESIIALGNKVWMLEKQLEFSHAETVKIMLIDVKTGRNNIISGQLDPCLLAEAEIAYSYTRFGPLFSKAAMSAYDTVIDKVRTAGIEVDINRWQYEKALAARRLASYYIMGSGRDITDGDILKLFREAIYAVDGIIQISQCNRLKARSWAMLGEICSAIDAQFKKETTNQIEPFPSHLRLTSPSQMCDNALGEYNQDGKVLETCGKVYRHIRMTEKAIECLQNANGIRETSFAHHHLALALWTNIKQSRRIGDFGQRQPTSNWWHRTTRRPFKLRGSRQFRNSGRQHAAEHDTQSDKPFTNTAADGVKGALMRYRFPRSHIPCDEHAEVILNHFKKAVELTPGNYPAQKNLGDFYSNLGMYESAKHLYQEVINSDSECSPSMLVACCEHTGFCNLKLGENELISEEEKSKFCHDAEYCFIKAVEICTSKANKALMGTVWKSLTTLKQLWTTNDTHNKIKLGELNEMLGNYREANEVYLEIQQDDQTDASICIKRINNHFHLREFDKALYLLNIIKCSKSSRDIQPDIAIKCYIEGAIESLSRNCRTDAKIRFKDALIHDRTEADVNTMLGADDSRTTSDAFIIVSGEIEGNERLSVEALKTLLIEECGLCITSTDDIRPGDNYFIEYSRLMESTNQQIIFLDKANNDPLFEEMMSRSSQLQTYPPILVVTTGTCKPPHALERYPALEFGILTNELHDNMVGTVAGGSTSETGDASNVLASALNEMSLGETHVSTQGDHVTESPHCSTNVNMKQYFLRRLFYIMCDVEIGD